MCILPLKLAMKASSSRLQALGAATHENPVLYMFCKRWKRTTLLFCFTKSSSSTLLSRDKQPLLKDGHYSRFFFHGWVQSQVYWNNYLKTVIWNNFHSIHCNWKASCLFCCDFGSGLTLTFLGRAAFSEATFFSCSLLISNSSVSR